MLLTFTLFELEVGDYCNEDYMEVRAFDWCLHQVCLLPGNRVLLTFTLFELEAGDYCNEDYVEVRKDSAIGPLIGVYCGSDIPSNVTAAAKLWVKFRSTGAGTAKGFVADYSLCE